MPIKVYLGSFVQNYNNGGLEHVLNIKKEKKINQKSPIVFFNNYFLHFPIFPTIHQSVVSEFFLQADDMAAGVHGDVMDFEKSSSGRKNPSAIR